MSQSRLLPTKDEGEFDCASKFISVYSPKSTLQRAVEVFPELKDQGDWDFNAEVPNSEEWDSIELKSVKLEEFVTRINYWSKIWNDVGLSVDNIEGFYALIAPQPLPHPSWPPTHLRNEIESAIKQVCERLLPGMNPGEILDLGPEISQLTDNWAKQNPEGVMDVPGDMSTYRVVYAPVEFNVSRGIKDTTGDPVMELIPISEAFEVDNIDIESLTKLVSKADKQLARSKQKGCRRSIMLICDDKGTNPNDISAAISTLPKTIYANIDQIWLVGNSVNRVA